MQTDNNPLESFKTKAIQAHNWTSFSPEKRGEDMITDYGNELVEDMEYLKKYEVSEESITDYVNRYKRFFSSYLNAKSNTFSVMITGGGNFPVRKHEKANRSEERHYTIFREWRERAKKAIIRKAQPVKTFVSELDRYRNELESMKANHVKMKEGNKRISKALKDGENIDQYLTDVFGIQPHMLEWTMKFGFGLTNNNANMKRVEGRIKELEQKEVLRANDPQKDYPFTGGVMIVNYEADRIQIKHDNKPDSNIISLLKKNGFKWSPTNGVWQRQITNNALWVAKNLLKELTTN